MDGCLVCGQCTLVDEVTETWRGELRHEDQLFGSQDLLSFLGPH